MFHYFVLNMAHNGFIFMFGSFARWMHDNISQLQLMISHTVHGMEIANDVEILFPPNSLKIKIIIIVLLR